MLRSMDNLVDIAEPARTRGRAPAELQVAFVRDLSADDIGSLSEVRGTQPQTVKRMRDSHHALAQALASGMKPGDAAATVGYSLSRVSILQRDPAFQELLAHYQRVVGTAFAGVQERMAAFNRDLIEELHERFIDDPDSFEAPFIAELITKFADRTGHGPSSKSVNLNVNVDLADRLQAARQRASLGQSPLPGLGQESGTPALSSAPVAEVGVPSAPSIPQSHEGADIIEGELIDAG